MNQPTYNDVNYEINNFRKSLKQITDGNFKKLTDLNDKVDKTVRTLERKTKELTKLQSTIDESLFVYSSKFDNIEEMFLTLYYSIKKNQWLYADDREAWWDEFLELKRQAKEDIAK